MSDRIPTYRRHKQSGQAVVTLTDGLGGRRDVLLGKHGTKASRAEYARVLGEWEASGRRLPLSLDDAAGDLTVVELIARYWPWAQQHYRHADGSQTGELKEIKLSLRPLREMYGHTSAKGFGPLALKAIRDRMVNQPVVLQGKVKRQGLARGVVNQRIGRIRRLFKWGVANELVPSSVLHGLQAVDGLKRGRSAARETRKVQPIAEQHVHDSLPYLMPTVADMVQLQLLTGMRSGEIITMRGIDLDTSGKVWLYRPVQHKTLHHGKERTVAIGPRGQEIVHRHLKPDLHAYLFSPVEAVEEKRRLSKARRRTKVYPCESKRVAAKKKARPKRVARDKYTPDTYAGAIGRAITRANKKREAEGLPAIPHWHPHRLRHSAATKARREAGLDAARALLGHSSPVIADHYAELDTLKAVELVARIG